MKLLQAIALLSLLGSGCGEAIQGVETEAPDAQSIDVGDPSWPVCPSAWPPAPRLGLRDIWGHVLQSTFQVSRLERMVWSRCCPARLSARWSCSQLETSAASCSAMGFGTTP